MVDHWDQWRSHGQGSGFWGKSKCRKIKYSTLFLCLMAIFQQEMGQNQQYLLKNQKKSTRNQFLSVNCWFWPISSRKMTIRHKDKVGHLIFFTLIFFQPQNPVPLPMISKTALTNILKICSFKSTMCSKLVG